LLEWKKNKFDKQVDKAIFKKFELLRARGMVGDYRDKKRRSFRLSIKEIKEMTKEKEYQKSQFDKINLEQEKDRTLSFKTQRPLPENGTKISVPIYQFNNTQVNIETTNDSVQTGKTQTGSSRR
jgi:hypothetical protein